MLACLYTILQGNDHTVPACGISERTISPEANVAYILASMQKVPDYSQSAVSNASGYGDGVLAICSSHLDNSIQKPV